MMYSIMTEQKGYTPAHIMTALRGMRRDSPAGIPRRPGEDTVRNPYPPSAASPFTPDFLSFAGATLVGRASIKTFYLVICKYNRFFRCVKGKIIFLCVFGALPKQCGGAIHPFVSRKQAA